MKISKINTNNIKVGDIIIVDWKEVNTNNLPVYLTGYENCNYIDMLDRLFEGETEIFLYEVDDIDITLYSGHDLNSDIPILSYRFYHIDESRFDLNVDTPINYKWDVIRNPHKANNKGND